MACVKAPTVPTPALPSPFKLEVKTLPAFSGNVELCCKLVQFEVVPPPVSLPPLALTPAAIAAVFQAAGAVNSWLASLQIDCPKE